MITRTRLPYVEISLEDDVVAVWSEILDDTFHLSIPTIREYCTDLREASDDVILDAVKHVVWHYQPGVVLRLYGWFIDHSVPKLPDSYVQDDKPSADLLREYVDLCEIAEKYDILGLHDAIMTAIHQR